MPLIATRGAASAQGFGEFAQSGPVNYIEDVFSTYLYTGNGSSQTITNGIDLSGKGGLVWIKQRSGTAMQHNLIDTARGPTNRLSSNSTDANSNDGGSPSFNSNGFTYAVTSSGYGNNGQTYASWTFREQPKFFDVVTYSGSSSTQNIAHNLGSVPGCIIVKRTSGIEDWFVYHTSLGNTQYLKLNTTGAAASGFAAWNNTSPTSTQFTVLGGRTEVNAAGSTYVAYLFAHDAGGFGLTGSDNVISCGSFTTDGSGKATINLGYEPQWLLVKGSSFVSNWFIVDTMRGLDATSLIKPLYANSSAAEDTDNSLAITSTGFNSTTGSSLSFIYIAIRRGPMKTPTTGTSVFAPVTRTGTGADVTVTGAGFPPDFLFNIDRLGTGPNARYNYDRLRGAGQTDLRTNSTAAEGSAGAIGVSSFNMNGFSIPSTGVSFLNVSSASYINYFFGRAPGFFDVVCYTGNGGGLGTTVPHNLGVLPELIIVKARSGSGNWWVAHKDVFFNGILNLTDAWNTFAYNASISFSTATQLSTAFSGNTNGVTFVAYLFASVAGVSKVGSYTGTGALQTVNCGFTTGARFVLIKRTDSTGDWWVYDSARGISSGNDPYLFLNSSTNEVTGTNYVDTTSVGFQVTAAAPAGLNANGGTYIFLAIA